jgi:hypothetical protein
MKLDSIKAAAAGWLPDALMLGGAGATSYGARLIYAPAGWIVAGILMACMGFLLARSGK